MDNISTEELIVEQVEIKPVKPKKEKKVKIPKELKIKPPKQLKCEKCKTLHLEEELLTWDSEPRKEGGKISVHHLCEGCWQLRQDRIDFFQYYCKVLDIPKTDKETVIQCESWKKNGYSFKVILHALKSKENEVKKWYQSKGVFYVNGIIRNQLNLSLKILQDKEKNDEVVQQKQEMIKHENIIEQEYEYIPQKSKHDISDLL